MQPVTPLRQQHQHLPANSRPRRSTAESSSRRSTRLQAAAASVAAPVAGPSTATALAMPPSSPHNTDTEDSLAPPLALTRKRPRAAVSPAPEQAITQDDIEETLVAVEDIIDREFDDGTLTEAQKKAIVDQYRYLLQSTAKLSAGAEAALACSDADRAQAILKRCTEEIPPKPHDLRDLFANGRALYNATTTSLAAPAEIPNKKPRLASTTHYEQDAEASTSKSKGTATPLEATLATPKHTSKGINDGVVDTRRPPSKRAAAVNANAAVSATVASTSKRRSASKSTAAAGGSASRRNKAQKDDERRQQQEHDAAEWKKKYKRAFKSFVFYFDSFDVARKREAEKCVKELGAQVESFFSKQVSHVVTTRIIPTDKAAAQSSLIAGNASLTVPGRGSIFQAPSAPQGGKENVQVRNSSESPLKQAAKDAFGGPSRRSKTRLGAANPNNLMFPLKTPPKSKAFADLEKTESKDILVKAQSFGMKLWNIEKLQRVLERLMGDDSPAQSLFRQNATVYNAPHVAAGHAFNLQMNGNAPKPTLPSLLRAEAITGSTYERDLNTLRPDYLYFNPKNGYILVEDTSGEFQPAHAKEYHQRIYPKPGDEDRDTEWPTLWGGQEGRQAFYKASASYRPSLPSIELLISNERGCAPEPDRTVPVSSSKKQSTSQGSQVADPPSYLAASGNSQIITSNIQSATSTRSGQALGANGGKDVVRKVTDGFIVDKRLARLGSKNAHIVTIGAAHVQTSQNGSVSGELARRQLARANSGRAGAGDVVDFLQKKNARPVAPQPKKPGYCENCRVRFEDFKTHTRTKKHRRFALDEANWKQLDELFSRIKRPVNPELVGLYDEAGCEIPSDIEASDKEEDDESSDEEDFGEEEDSGYAGMSAEFENNPLQAAKRRELLFDELQEDDGDDEEDEEDDDEAAFLDNTCIPCLGNATRTYSECEEDDEEDEEDEDDDSDDDEVVGTSEEEQALETASDEDDEFAED